MILDHSFVHGQCPAGKSSPVGSEIKEFPLIDAHTHLGTKAEQNERLTENMISLVCAGHPGEVHLVRILTQKTARSSSLSHEEVTAGEKTSPGRIFASYGLHPWYTDQYPPDAMLPFFNEVGVIGELGMDSVWAKIPLHIQEKAFRVQLSEAARMKKPVILHTKGQEKEIARIIAEYPNRYYVHWYSCMDYLQTYLNLDCYFSVGPDIWWSRAARQVASKVPENRLLTETDGFASVLWANEEAPENLRKDPAFQPHNVKESLLLTLRTAAQLRGISPEKLREIVYRNFLTFISGK